MKSRVIARKVIPSYRTETSLIFYTKILLLLLTPNNAPPLPAPGEKDDSQSEESEADPDAELSKKRKAKGVTFKVPYSLITSNPYSRADACRL